MSEVKALPVIGSEDFWVLYDRFCTPQEFGELVAGKQTELCMELQSILRAGHMEIVKLPRESKGWHYPKAWLVLRHEDVIHKDGYIFLTLQAGDVMTREFGWDRDVFITHSPIIERVSGQFLGQSWPGAEKGLFLPLYTTFTILAAIHAKLEENTSRAMNKAVEECHDWGWY